MKSYTNRGLTEISGGLAEAKQTIRTRRTELQSRIGLLEAELTQLARIETAVSAAYEVLVEAKVQREAAEKMAMEKVPT